MIEKENKYCSYLKVDENKIDMDYYDGFTGQADYENRKLNIAMFTNNYFPFIGGVPVSINHLAKGLSQRGHKVYIFAPEYPNDRSARSPDTVRCKLLSYYKTKQFNFAVVNIFSSEIIKTFATLKIDVIHVHHPFWMGSLGLKLGKRFGVPVILTYHTRLEKYSHFVPCFRLVYKKILSRHIIKRFGQKCNVIFAPTNSVKEYLENIGVSGYKAILPTGIDLDYSENIKTTEIENIRKQYANENETLLCTVSRLSEEKNISFLLEGILKLKQKTQIDFKCLVIGDGPQKNNILSNIKKKGLEKTIFLLGSIEPEEVSKYYLASDIFIFSSQSETQGIVLLEAMAGKCPIVAIRSSGIEDIVKEGYNGFKTQASIDLWSNKIYY